MEVLAIWIIITELPNILIFDLLDQYLGIGEPLRV